MWSLDGTGGDGAGQHAAILLAQASHLDGAGGSGEACVHRGLSDLLVEPLHALQHM